MTTEKKQDATEQTSDFASGWADTVRTIIADAVGLEKTRTGTKSLSQNIADRYVSYAKTTPSKIDDAFGAKLKTEVDEHFSEWYEYFLTLLGLEPTGKYVDGMPIYSLAVAPDDTEIDQHLARPSVFLGQVSERFGASVNKVKKFIKALAPVVVELYIVAKPQPENTSAT